MRRIIIESTIPFTQGIASQLGEVSFLESREFSPERITNADALVIRSITPCTASLLRNSRVSFVATATAGFEHIDTDYCDSHNIGWSNAPGCNALAVVQYVLSSLSFLSLKEGFSLEGKTIGIIGVGHVGSRLATYCQGLGMHPLLYDPPRAKQEGEECFVSLDTILKESDIISLHVPLTTSGLYPTYHMVDRDFLSKLERKPILINACRGRVTDTESLIGAKQTGLLSHLIIDCWEGEPEISVQLLSETDLASPHIAGFSADGKFNATRLALGAVGKAWGIELQGLMDRSILPPPSQPLINLDEYPSDEALRRALLHSYDIEAIDRSFRSQISLSQQTLNSVGTKFEELRKAYIYCREMSAYTINSNDSHLIERAKLLGFRISNDED